jgi:hypothetical protein
MLCAVAAGALTLGSGAVAVLAGPASATDSTDTTTPPSTAAPVVAAESVTTLPLFGAPLSVDVATTPSGALASVAVTLADGSTPTDLTATKVRANQVAFVNDAKTGKVRVEARRGADKVGVTAGALNDILGPGGWSGDVFGTGTKTTVSFQIVAGTDGAPDISAVTTSDPSAKVGDVQHNNDDHVKAARVTITFTAGIQTRRLTIAASVFTIGDTTKAASQVLLSKISGTTLPADQAAGAHTWTGMLCDGSTANVAYTVASDGTITAGAVTPSTATATADGNTLRVKFSDTESLVITVVGKDGNLRISASPRLRCGRTTPTVNTPTSTNPPEPHRTPTSSSVDPSRFHHDGTGGTSATSGTGDSGSRDSTRWSSH